MAGPGGLHPLPQRPVPGLRGYPEPEPGLARELSLPVDQHYFHSPLLESYRVLQGVLHNPSKDRRTTAGVFHIVEGGLPVPADKKEVPVVTFARLLAKYVRQEQVIPLEEAIRRMEAGEDPDKIEAAVRAVCA